ncbi:MAG TPA: protein-glutamate O-methyltransferase CheR [Polyangiaceae bacterium]|nr:protein-glutamate O-methyltransferase CheR [Polyangiaceae bacterium]
MTQVVDAAPVHELTGLLDTILEHYHYDFRHYALASMRRRVAAALQSLNIEDVASLRAQVAGDAQLFARLLDFMTVPVSDMFRDPEYYRELRVHVVPVLRTYPSLKIWVAGCSTGEEVYSLAIVLQEEELLERTMIYATDINPRSLARAEAGIYPLDRVRRFTENHQAAGAKSSLSTYYSATHGAALFDRKLKKRVVFSDHSLATDSVFAEVQLISCRNVLIYFDKQLQERALSLFGEALCRRGFLGLGARETLRFSGVAAEYTELAASARIYQRRH